MRYAMLLPVCMAATALFGTALLGMGQRDPVRPLLMLSVAVTAVYFNDWKGWFRLGRVAGNVGALVAAAMALMDFSRFDRDQWLLAIAHLLVYLQIVLLYQEKTNRRYWQLLVMSLLQVIVAAVLSLSVLFGLLLVLYLFLAMATMALFFIWRETTRYPTFHGIDQGLAQLAPAPERISSKVPGAAHPARRADWVARLLVFWRAMAWRSARRDKPTGAAECPKIRPTVTGPFPASLRFFALDAGPADRPTDHWNICRNTTRLVATTLVVAIVIFFSIPRFGSKPWQGTGGAPRRVVGFSHKIQLGDLGYVVENPELVMRVQFVDLAANKPLKMTGDLLLRGSVVTWYNSGMRRWSQSSHRYSQHTEPLDRPPTTAGLVSQKITLEPLSEPVVCCVFPAYRLDAGTPVRFNPAWDQLERPEQTQNQQISVQLGTLGFHAGRQVAVTPRKKLPTTDDLSELEQWPRRGVRSGNRGPLAGLKRVAAQVLRRAGISPADRVRAAQALAAFLRDSGQFQYTLQPATDRPRNVDPVEDFVVRRHRGHCEYFASALALMLRGQGIPSRVVIGFKGGDWNSWGKFYQFRQLHAHTWVEVYLRPHEVAGLPPAMGAGGPGGGWLTLDPTPTLAVPTAVGVTGVVANARQAAAYAQMLWTSYVVGLNQQKQHNSIYAPVARFLLRTIRDVANPRAWRTRITQLFHHVHDALWAWLDGHWFSWRGGLAAMAICLVLAGFYQVVRLVWRWLRTVLARRRHRRQNPAALGVQFYNRLETLLGSVGINRPASATQREFATVAGGQLSRLPQAQAVASIPRQIVDAFYRVRFGRKNLDKVEAEAVERGLGTLETVLRDMRHRRLRTPS